MVSFFEFGLLLGVIGTLESGAIAVSRVDCAGAVAGVGDGFGDFLSVIVCLKGKLFGTVNVVSAVSPRLT